MTREKQEQESLDTYARDRDRIVAAGEAAISAAVLDQIRLLEDGPDAILFARSGTKVIVTRASYDGERTTFEIDTTIATEPLTVAKPGEAPAEREV